MPKSLCANCELGREVVAGTELCAECTKDPAKDKRKSATLSVSAAEYADEGVSDLFGRPEESSPVKQAEQYQNDALKVSAMQREVEAGNPFAE